MLLRLQELDLRLFTRATERRSGALDEVLPRLTSAADHSKLWFALALLMGLGRNRTARRAALRGVGSLAAASAVANLVGKRVTRRTRPPLDLVPAARRARRVPLSTSFPSGHSASAAAFATGVALESPVLGLPVAALAGAVAYSRIYTGVHYPGDVAAGLALGIGLGVASTRSWPRPVDDPAEAPPVPAAEHLPATTDGAGLVAVINPAAGTAGPALLEKLRERLPGAEVVELAEGADLSAALEKAAGRARVLGVAGGDGTINAGARAALAAGLPLLVLPGGTLDHFARDLGLADVDAAIDALQAGTAVRVDVAEIDGRPFLNTASFGGYSALVDARERWQARVGKWPALALAVLTVLPRLEPAYVEIDGRRRKVWMIFIGNCVYSPAGFTPVRRANLVDGRLDVRLVDAGAVLGRSRVLLAVLTGRLGRCRVYAEWDAAELRVRWLGEDEPRLATDGETRSGSREFVVRKAEKQLVVYRPPAAGESG
ncbi:MAG: phosphatase PAP2 family protein [Actinomycetota bacterium]|nr:phosphatase PAP2 family protein [Actinomycetota bacterium]